MHKIQAAIIALALSSGIASFGQSFSAHEWEIISLGILNMRSENVRLKADAVTDSVTIQELTTAYYFKDSALTRCQVGLTLSRTISQDYYALSQVKDKQLAEAKKEIRKQKRIKWLGFILIPVVVILTN